MHNLDKVENMLGLFGFGPSFGTRNVAHMPHSFEVEGSENMADSGDHRWDTFCVPQRWKPGQWYEGPGDGMFPRRIEDPEQGAAGPEPTQGAAGQQGAEQDPGQGRGQPHSTLGDAGQDRPGGDSD